MTLVETPLVDVTPVKGLVWVHNRRLDRLTGQPKRYTVTSVNRATNLVYSRDDLYYGKRIKTPLATFANFVAEVVYQPVSKAADKSPHLTIGEALLLHAKADAAGREAAEGVVPEPMYVVQRANPIDDTSPIIRAYPPVMDGPCGFAWVTVRPGNSSYARFLKERLGARIGYEGGMQHWIDGYGQSITRKQAYAQAYAGVLRNVGINAYPGSRLD